MIVTFEEHGFQHPTSPDPSWQRKMVKGVKTIDGWFGTLMLTVATLKVDGYCYSLHFNNVRNVRVS